MKNFVTGLAMLLGAVIVNLNLSTRLRSQITGKGLSELFWPQALLIILMAMCAILMVQGLREMKASKSGFNFDFKNLFDGGTTRLVAAIVVCFIYVQALQPLGFVIATPIYLSVMLFFIGFRGFIKLIPASICITIFCAFCFSTLARLPLPSGTGVFQAVNLFFM